MVSTKIVQYTKSNMLVPVKKSFVELSNQVYEDLGISLVVEESYKYKWEIVDELRGLVKKEALKEVATGSFSVNYVSNQTKMLDIVTTQSGSVYENIEAFIDSLPSNEFEPPLGPNIQSIRSTISAYTPYELVYSIPNYTHVDPRRTGRIVRIGPRNVINPTLLKYLVDNAGKYGFMHYGPQDPAVWYWRADKLPITDPITGELREYYTSYEVVNSFTGELSYLLY